MKQKSGAGPSRHPVIAVLFPLRIYIYANPFIMIFSNSGISHGHPIGRGCFTCASLYSWGRQQDRQEWEARPQRQEDGAFPVLGTVFLYHVTF